MKEYIKYDEGTFSSLTKEQKKSIALLSIGTFLEYFDLMLYVHMAVLLNELFFPKADPHTAAIYSAFAFCSTYVLRPLGALIFGWIGDNIGRKPTIIITTFLMSCSCLVMTIIPTYAEKGLIATALVTMCRIIQGISCMGESIGASIYVTEMTKPPIQYSAVELITVCGALGGTCALGIASLVISFNLNWRYAFLFGAVVAIVSAVARTALRETPDFADAKRRIKKIVKKVSPNLEIVEQSSIWKEKVNKKTTLALFCIECSWPMCFYIAYVYYGSILKSSFYLNAEQVIHHNFVMSIVQLFSWAILIFLSYIIYPLKIVKVRLMIFLVFVLLSPYLLNYYVKSSFDIMLIQLFFVIFGLMGTPAAPIFYRHFPVFKRFTYASFTYALGRAFTYIITSFGLVYLTDYFNHWTIFIVMIPTAMIFLRSINYFEKLEKNLRRQ